MIPLDTLLMFTAASTALALAPGPDNIFVLSQSMLHGRRAGFFVTLGLCSGLVVHIAAVALGIAAVLVASTVAFTLLKVLGAAYLLYLAWGAFRAGGSSLPSAAAERSGKALYLRGILMNVSNPKVAIFFLAFLPQFVDMDRGSVAVQIVILGLVFMAAAFLVFCGIAWAANSLGKLIMGSVKAQRIINRVVAGIFVLLAGRLLLSAA